MIDVGEAFDVVIPGPELIDPAFKAKGMERD